MLAASGPGVEAWGPMTPAAPEEGTRSATTDRPSAPQRAVALAFEGFARVTFRAYITLDVRGREKLPDGGFVVVSNHASHLDAMVILHVCGGPFRRFHLAAAGDYFFGPAMAAAAGRKPSRFGGAPPHGPPTRADAGPPAR